MCVCVRALHYKQSEPFLLILLLTLLYSAPTGYTEFISVHLTYSSTSLATRCLFTKLSERFTLFAAMHARRKAASLWFDNRQGDAPYLVSVCRLPADIQPNYLRLLEGPYSQQERMFFKK